MHTGSPSHRVVVLVCCVGASALTFAACGSSSGSSFGDGASSSGSSGASSGMFGGDGGSSSGASGSSGSSGGVAATCIVGSQGCLCDPRGQCEPGLTCTPQTGAPATCCSGSSCTGTGTGIGTICPMGSGGGAAACTPGTVTVPAATAGNDGCGYPTSSFNESIIFCGMTATGGGDAPAIINVFYSDEHAMPLGCANAANPVSAYPGTPSALYYPQTGDPACTDTVMRPLRPVLYITDITADPTCTTGDQQHGGQPYYPVAVFGSWKSASESGTIGSPTGGDPTGNGWTLGAGADPVPAAVLSACPNGGGKGGGGGGAYGTEIQFAAGLVPGHSYRLQTILHDGDQTRGADSGEGCAVFCASAGVACQPACGTCTGDANCCSGLTCNNGQCGPCVR